MLAINPVIVAAAVAFITFMAAPITAADTAYAYATSGLRSKYGGVSAALPTFIVVGRTGVGKSRLSNYLMGRFDKDGMMEEVFEFGGGSTAVTKTVQCEVVTLTSGDTANWCDIPGLQDPEADVDSNDEYWLDGSDGMGEVDDDKNNLYFEAHLTEIIRHLGGIDRVFFVSPCNRHGHLNDLLAKVNAYLTEHLEDAACHPALRTPNPLGHNFARLLISELIPGHG